MLPNTSPTCPSAFFPHEINQSEYATGTTQHTDIRSHFERVHSRPHRSQDPTWLYMNKERVEHPRILDRRPTQFGKVAEVGAHTPICYTLPQNERKSSFVRSGESAHVDYSLSQERLCGILARKLSEYARHILFPRVPLQVQIDLALICLAPGLSVGDIVSWVKKAFTLAFDISSMSLSESYADKSD
jgi:hypothetical protein